MTAIAIENKEDCPQVDGLCGGLGNGNGLGLGYAAPRFARPTPCP